MPSLVRYTTSTISDYSNVWSFMTRSGTYTDEGSSWGGSQVAVQPNSPTTQDSSYGSISVYNSGAILEMNCQAIPATAYGTINSINLWAHTSDDDLEECSVRVGGTWNTNNTGKDASADEWDRFDFVPSTTDMSGGLTLAVRLLGSSNEDFYSAGGYVVINYTVTPPPASGKLLPMITSAYQDDTTEF